MGSGHDVLSYIQLMLWFWLFGQRNRAFELLFCVSFVGETPVPMQKPQHCTRVRVWGISTCHYSFLNEQIGINEHKPAFSSVLMGIMYYHPPQTFSVAE